MFSDASDLKKWFLGDLIQLPKLVWVSEWADNNRYIFTGTAKPGKFNSSIFPAMREPMDMMGHPLAEELRMIKSSQDGYSEAVNNYWGRQIHINPGSGMMMLPTLGMGERYSKKRLAPMFRETPVLASIINDKSRNGNNTILEKHYAGGSLTLVGANSPASLSSDPVRDVVIDEEDRTAQSAGEEGDPEALIKKRQKTFRTTRKLIAGGTPTVDGKSKTQRNHLKGDQRLYQVECPHCHDHIDLIWEEMQSNPKEDNYAEYKCQKCKSWIKHHSKFKMIKDKLAGGTAYWLPTARSTGKEEFETLTDQDRSELYNYNDERGYFVPKRRMILSYATWSAYSPVVTWQEICDEYNMALGDPDLLQTFYNTMIGRAYKYKAHDMDAEQLFKDAQLDASSPIPKSVRCLTAGVDTQNDRFEIQIVGWSQGEEAYILDHVTIEGDPESNTVRKDLYEKIKTLRYERDDGRALKISSTFIDMGGSRTDSVYQLARGRTNERIFACKGLSTAGNPIFSGFSKLKNQQIKLARVGTDTAKELIYAKLAGSEDTTPFHISNKLPLSFFEGLISEDREVKANGQIKFTKPSSKTRNEPLDCLVYAYAAMRSLPIAKSLRRLSARMKDAQDKAAGLARSNDEATEGDLNEIPLVDMEIIEEEQQEVKKTKPRRKSSLVSRARRVRRR